MKEKIDLNLSRRNRRGLFVLGVFTLLIIYTPRIYFAIKPADKISIESFPSKKWEEEHSFKTSFSNDYNYNRKRRAYRIPSEKFDPNEYTKSDWMKLGLSSKQADVVLKFTSRGVFSNTDLKKIFVIPKELYLLIKDSTVFPARKWEHQIAEESVKSSEFKVKIVELNTASEEDLLKLKGIGAFFAGQIIRKRNELGGFVKKEQLLEVWKMDEEKYLMLKDQVEVNAVNITKIALNSISIEELKKHPYFRWHIANSVIKMRSQRNGFKTIEEIKESALIDEELFEKLKPYLSL